MKKNNGDDPGKINEDKGGGSHRGGRVWVREPPSRQVSPAAGPSCGTVISKITVGRSSLASVVYGKEGGTGGEGGRCDKAQ